MKNNAQPPSCLRSLIFLIGQDSRGNWVVQEKTGCRGGLFVDRAQALRYIRAENGNRPYAFVTVTGVFELDMRQSSGAARHRQPSTELTSSPQREMAG
jgi:hypothetical protein